MSCESLQILKNRTVGTIFFKNAQNSRRVWRFDAMKEDTYIISIYYLTTVCATLCSAIYAFAFLRVLRIRMGEGCDFCTIHVLIELYHFWEGIHPIDQY